MTKWASTAVLLLVLGIQFIRPAKNQSSAGAEPFDAITYYKAPPEIARILHTACYDCHSNHTRYPWYADVQPFAWFLAKHIKEGKEQLNLSELGRLSKKRQAKKRQAMIDEASDRTMPLPSYLLIHRDAKLSNEEIETLAAWVETLQDDEAPN